MGFGTYFDCFTDLDQSGRHRWRVVWKQHQDSQQLSMHSLVGFESKAAAQDDLDEFMRASVDANGRRIRSREHVQRMMEAAQAECPSCRGAVLGGVVWHENDDTGCNWEINYANGDDIPACMDEISVVYHRLRQTFNIADEGEQA